MENKRELLLKILYIYCYVTDESGSDDIYLMMDHQKIWPEDQKFLPIRPGRTPISVELKGYESGTSIKIEIWDYDYISNNDLLGTVCFLIDEPGGPYITDMIQNQEETEKAKYSIEWELDYL
jgi:hypothetical protein